MLKIYFFQVALNTCKMWSNGIKIAFFFQKIVQRLGASLPDPHNLRKLGISPDPHLEYTWVTQVGFTRLSLRHFCYFTLGLSPLPFAKSWFSAKTRLRLLIFHFMISLSHKKFFWKILMTWLHVISGLAPLPIKNPGYSYGRAEALDLAPFVALLLTGIRRRGIIMLQTMKHLREK